jgi:hypothetical protein
MTLVDELRAAWRNHETEARAAHRLFVGHCQDVAPCRVPGMDTVLRLAYRISLGRSIEEAAAREYLYRWNLALRSPVFGVPHTLGF